MTEYEGMDGMEMEDGMMPSSISQEIPAPQSPIDKIKSGLEELTGRLQEIMAFVAFAAQHGQCRCSYLIKDPNCVVCKAKAMMAQMSNDSEESSEEE